jgi:uncharacterized protein YfaS (alpha-2-macroglobulin family)
MRTNKRYQTIILLLVTTLLVTTFCSLFGGEEEQTPVAVDTDTPSPAVPTETLVPTNQVQLGDDGSPLPPQVVELYPDGGQEISADGSIEISFDQAMDQSATEAALQIFSSGGERVKGQITWSNERDLSFVPADQLETGEIYRLNLSTDAASVAGIPLLDPINIDIQVAGALLISQVFPEAGTSEVENNAVVTVVFNRPVVPLLIAEEQANLPQPVEFTPPISGQGEWVNTSVYVFHPDEPLLSSTKYTALVPSGLVDTIGAILEDDYSWDFTTVAPSVSSFGTHSPINMINPGDNYQGVRLESSFLINFRQPMESESVADAFTLNTQSGETVPVVMDWIAPSQVIITPTQQLALGTSYTFLLTQNAKAATGGTLFEPLRWDFTTVKPPGVYSTYPADGSTQTYYSSRFEITFNSPMEIETIPDLVVFTPEIEGEARYYYDTWSNGISFFGLRPSTNYSVKILPGMLDIYGNPNTEGVTVRFTTAARDPSARLELPYAPAIYRIGGPGKFYASYVNINSVDFELYRLSADVFSGFISGERRRWDYTPTDSELVNEWHETNRGKLDERTFIGLPLETAAGEPLSPGFYFLTIDTPQISHKNPFLDTRLLVMANANLTFKTTQNEALVWLTDLDSGAPLEGVSLSVYDEDYRTIRQGSTNANGLLELELPLLSETYDQRYVMTNLHGDDISQEEVFAFAASNWGSGVSPYDFGVWSSYYTRPDQPAVYVYTDRPLYRPGHPVSFKGIVRMNDDLAYSLPSEEIVEVTINSYDENVYYETFPLSEFGSFDGEFILDEAAALGYYSLEVRFPGEEQTIGGVSFSVAEYRKPEFQVTTDVTPTDVVAGEDFTVQINAEYFSGGGVAEAQVDWALRAIPYTFRPGGDLSRYKFSDFERDVYYGFYFEPTRTDVIASGEAQTDVDGNFDLTLSADLSETGESRQLTFEATVTDIAGTSVSDRTDVTAHQAAVYPGVRPQRYVGKAGEEQTFEFVVVDWDGEPVRGHVVDVTFVERRWYSVQEQDEEGYVHWVSTVEEIPIAEFEGLEMDADGRGEASFVPPNGGVFKAIVTTLDEGGHKARAGAYMWVSSSDYVSWRQTDDRRIELISDKDSYIPGETAEILIAHPFPGSNYALITVERGHIRQNDIIQLTSNSAVYQLPITSDMAPNIYVNVLVVKGAEKEDITEGEQPGAPDFRMGILELQVDTRDQELEVEIIPDVEQAGPGDKVTYTVRTTDKGGEPVRAELSLALADLATLSLSQPNSVPILDYFYAPSALSVRTAVPIVLSIEHYVTILEDRLTDGEMMGSGGGKGADDFGVFEIREDFPDTAYWRAHVVTDENGEASVTVTLPDNLTIWRMDARAVTLDTKVGDSTDDLRSTKPLLVRPQTPRFFVVGDQARLGAAVHNNSTEDLSVLVSLKAEGMSLSSPESQQLEIPAGRQEYVTWEVSVLPQVDRVDLIFSATGGGYSDATRPTMGTLEGGGIPVYKYEAPETVGTAGMLDGAGSQTEAIILPVEYNTSQGELTVRLSPSLAAGMVDGLDYLQHYPYECTEQTVSRFLPNVLTTRALIASGIDDPELEANLKEQVNIALQRLYNHQRADGGWGWWSKSPESSLLTSAYVILGLSEAQAAGHPVSEGVLTRGREYLRGNLQSLQALDHQYLLNRQAFVLYVLARSGQPQVSRSEQLYAIRQSLSLYAKAYLAETLYLIDSQDPRLGTMVSDFVNAAVLSATGAHWEEQIQDYFNWNSDTRTTAIVLAALIRIEPDNVLNANAVRWLMTHRTKGRWRSTQETAWSLMTLTNWMVASGELQADYDYAVGLNGERLGDGSATSDSIRETYELRLEVADLLSEGANRLTIARDDGPGNLYYTAHLNVYLPVEDIQALDRGVVVSRSYFQPEDRETPVTRAEQGDLLLARLTIVVPNSLHYLVLDDPLPAGLEAVDQSLQTSPQVTAPDRYDYDSIWERGWGWWYFDHVELRDERVVISADYLPPGTYVYTYLVRASTPGEYRVIPPTAQEFYFPEVYGRGDGSLFTVAP